MGNPSIYYKMCLQYCAHALAYMDNAKLAEELLKEKSEEKLEEFIMKKKSEMNEKQFYFDAGRAAQFMFDDVEQNDCNDGINASIGGFCSFEYFLGLRDDEEDE